MIVHDDEIRKLKNQINELNYQIDLVTKKKKEAESTVRKFSQELEQLSSRRHETSEELHRLEAAGCNIWENIGDGG